MEASRSSMQMFSERLKGTSDNDAMMGLGVVILLSVMSLPMPSSLLYVLLAVNIAISLVIMLTAVYSLKPLDFATFPSVLFIKFVAYFKIKRKLGVGIISVDTYRIGADNQISTYAEILDVPFMVVQSRSELCKARNQFDRHDVLLIDTSGKNFINRDHIKDLKAVFEGMDDIHHFLVLSATVKDGDLKQTIIHFDPMNIHSLIFTKIDETLSIGSMVNQLLRFPYPFSYLGTEQQVPEDIEVATPKRLLTFLFPARKGQNGKE